MISDGWVRERRFALPRLLPRRLRSLHTLGLVLALLLIGWLGWTWYRSSSFVKVESVKVTGLSGPSVPEIRDALSAAARRMTTLNVDVARLEAAVSEYPYVHALTVTSSGSHAVVIHVDERVPVAFVGSGSGRELVDADGAFLPSSTTVEGALPVVPVRSAQGAGSVSGPGARAAVAVLAAAPYALLAHISSATSSPMHGVIVQLRGGPQVYFGPSVQLTQKWEAAVAVLQNKGSVGASYIDVTDPERPASGVGVSPSQAAALGLASPGSSTTAGATGTTGNTSSVGG
jgi:cell division protein FtsQ